MQFNLVVLAGDGVGPEICAEAIKVMQAVGKRFGHSFNLKYELIGGAAIDATGEALTKDTIAKCKKSDAVLLGAVGGPKWDDPNGKVHPEDGLLGIRKALGLFANLRPVKLYPMLVNASNLKPNIVDGVDLVFVRELTSGIYFGRPKKQWQTARGRRAVDTNSYTEKEIERIVHVGFQMARSRRKKLSSVDKANVLQTSRLWRQIVTEIAPQYPEIEVEHVLVDACSMRLIQNPKNFDVLVADNMFGDILTDEASMLAGSMGMLPSASIAGIPQAGVRTLGMYEPIHGSAPRRAGQDIINPIATILSAAMLLRYSLALEKEAQVIEAAVEKVLQEGYRTYDIMSDGMKKVGTSQMGSLVAQRV